LQLRHHNGHASQTQWHNLIWVKLQAPVGSGTHTLWEVQHLCTVVILPAHRATAH